MLKILLQAHLFCDATTLDFVTQARLKISREVIQKYKRSVTKVKTLMVDLSLKLGHLWLNEVFKGSSDEDGI
jgi:hypothetical protein